MARIFFWIILFSIFSFNVFSGNFDQINDVNMETYLAVTKEVAPLIPQGKTDPSKGVELAVKLKAVCDSYNISMLEYATFGQKLALGIAQIEGVEGFVPLDSDVLSPDELKVVAKYLSRIKALIGKR